MKSKTIKTVLVAGGAGFVGSHLVEALLNNGDRVICVDNFVTGSRKNVAPWLHNANFELIEHDVNERINLEDEVNEVYNLACPASPVHYQKDPVFTLSTSVIGTKNLLEFAKERGARFLQASTSEVYGDPLEHPQKETYWGNVNPIGVRACYDEGKRAAETFCSDFRRKKEVDASIVRIFNTYGPRMAMNDGRVISNFIVQALQGEPITIYGDGSHTRSFQYIDDLIKGMILMMRKGIDGPINLGNPDEHTILELAEKIIELTSSGSYLKYEQLPGDDPVRRNPDISKARDLLGWNPQVGWNDGLKRTIEYFSSELNKSN